MKKTFLILSTFFIATTVFAQDSTATNSRGSKAERRLEKRLQRAAIIKQEEEGVLTYTRQNIFGLQLRTNGYGLFFEHGRTKSLRKTSLYSIEITENKHPKEERSLTSNGFFANSFIYGKINNLYSAKLGYGQQYILGQKGNKNGIAVMAVYSGGLNLGLLRPYYVTVLENGAQRDVKYESSDSTEFLNGTISGSSGLRKGWSELKIVPGAFLKAGLRFDFGQYNEIVKGVQIGASIEGYAQEIPLMVGSKPDRLFYQAHIALLFGRRK